MALFRWHESSFLETAMTCLKYLPVLGISLIAFNAHAVTEVAVSPSASLTIDGQQIGLEVVRGEKGFVVPKGTVVKTENAEITFTDGVQLNPDPSIAYGFAVVDFGAPSVFGFTFATPIVSTGPATDVAATLAGGLTDFTDDGIALTPTGGSLQTSGASSTGVGGPYSSMGVDVGPLFSAASGGSGLPVAHVYGPYTAGLIAGPAGGPFNALKVDLAFSLSGGGDIAVLTGSASIVDAATPDGGPGLAALGAIVAMIAAHRRIRSR